MRDFSLVIEADDNAAGWYPDPTGVHHQRYWAGGTWTARVADKYGATSAHHADGIFDRPTDAAPTPSSRSTLPPSNHTSTVRVRAVAEPSLPAPPQPARVVLGDMLQGWQPDPFGRFSERYYVAGQPSQVVRTNDVEAIDPTFTSRAVTSHRRPVSPQDSGASRNVKMIGIAVGAVVIVLLLAALKG